MPEVQTYTPETNQEFLEAVQVYGAIVNCPENHVYDFSEESRKRIVLRAGEINGNGATVKGLKVEPITTDRFNMEPVTTVNGLIVDSISFGYVGIGSQEQAAFSYSEQNGAYSPTFNFNNCQISCTFEETIHYFVKSPSTSATNFPQGYFNFYASSINLNIEYADFAVSMHTYSQRREGYVTLDICKVDINAPMTTHGNNALYCDWHKCDIYLYMPRWDGYAPDAHSMTNGMEGAWFRSCVIKGNLSHLAAGNSMASLLTTTQDISVMCATLADNYIDIGDTAVVRQLRVMTPEQARDPIELRRTRLVSYTHFDLVLYDPTDTDWQIDPAVNDGFPFIALMPNIIRVNPVKKRSRLRIYDMSSSYTALQKNGLAVLDATSATIHEVMNSEYTLTFEHPIDNLGKWQYIRESNIVKCLGQYFTIIRCEWNFTGKNSGSVTAYCEHIFYQNNDLWIYPDDTPQYEISTCKSSMDAIMAASRDYDDPTMHRFVYEWASDWTFASPFFLQNDSGMTPVDAMMGSTGILGLMGGELYRDNFYYSINERMEGALDNAFDIRFGNNMAGVKRTIDSSELCTYFKLYDGRTGSWWAVSFTNSGFPLFQFPHTIVRSKKITYSDEIYTLWEEGALDVCDLLAKDGMRYWQSMCTPVICYEVDLVDTKNNPTFQALEGSRYKVGDSGRIHDSHMGGDIIIRITETTTNGLTGEVEKVVFGSKNSFTRPAVYPYMTPEFHPDESTTAIQLMDSDYKRIIDKDGKKIMRKVVTNYG